MAIWNDRMILEWVQQGGINPYDEACVNPASLDLRWSGAYRVTGKNGWSDVYHVDELQLEPNTFYLLDSLEFIRMPVGAAGKLFLKSSAGRLGIEHLHAGYVDPGFCGTLTWELEIRVPWGIAIQKHQRIMQLTLESMEESPLYPYETKGRYQNQDTPTLSKGLPE